MILSVRAATAAHALKGEIEQAKAPLAEAPRLYPRLSAKWISEEHKHVQFTVDALRSAGLPELECWREPLPSWILQPRPRLQGAFRPLD